MKKRWKRMAVLTMVFCLLLGCGKKAVQEEKKEPKTVGEFLAADFEAYKEENPGISAQNMAEHLLENSILPFSGLAMPIEEGLLTGFNNAQIEGFQEGVMFAPMMGTIPFIGYVFILEEGTDAQTFIKNLTDNADLRWNICTEADETITASKENMIFFVMCPTQFEENQPAE